MGSNGANQYCAHAVLDLLSRSWTLDILLALTNNGPTRFGALRRSVDGISARVLRERLRTLEEYKFVFRHHEPTIPPAVTYGLTERTGDVKMWLETMERFSQKWEKEDVGLTPSPNRQLTVTTHS